MPEGKDWPHRIEQSLHEDGFANVEVINAGIPGHTSFDSMGGLFAEGHHFKPDYVILYSTWNDIKRFSSDKFLLREMKCYQATDDPFLYYQNRFDQLLGENSLLYALIRYDNLIRKYKPRSGGGIAKEGTEMRIKSARIGSI